MYNENESSSPPICVTKAAFHRFNEAKRHSTCNTVISQENQQRYYAIADGSRALVVRAS